ncbi:TetR/AcrR family transcriptional regulator [Thalassotalea mangrovi]|uniref:TetR/AcrR family transcriptional regulator n=1 Tax=Thalassotalea mangrovi TaxID=2572245 RepID=A0A4U1B7Q3_9GAMM|nr:TetR/AcrR family transcriptional regulator [Thalassotalea mangrovi]TKB46653.1 TetR/AcrR family transcriptional regulator [Thalassotalea mangrovi]
MSNQSNDRKQQILDAARKCFLQFGYNTTSISMISRYADTSRVTIHKLFSGKEDIFRQVVDQHFKRTQQQVKNYRLQVSDIWQVVENIVMALGQPVFHDIKDKEVHQDLVKSCMQHTQDLSQAQRQFIRENLCSLFEHARDNQQISLKRIDMDCLGLAQSIETNVYGLLHSNIDLEAHHALQQTLKIYRAATQP